MFTPELCSLTENNCFYLIMEIGIIMTIFSFLGTFLSYVLYLVVKITLKDHIEEVEDIIDDYEEDGHVCSGENRIKKRNDPTEIIGLGFEVLGLVKNFIK